MSLPNRENPYSFKDFLEWRNNCDYYLEDKFFRNLLRYYAGDDWERLDKEIREFSKKASFRCFCVISNKSFRH